MLWGMGGLGRRLFASSRVASAARVAVLARDRVRRICTSYASALVVAAYAARPAVGRRRRREVAAQPCAVGRAKQRLRLAAGWGCPWTMMPMPRPYGRRTHAAGHVAVVRSGTPPAGMRDLRCPCRSRLRRRRILDLAARRACRCRAACASADRYCAAAGRAGMSAMMRVLGRAASSLRRASDAGDGADSARETRIGASDDHQVDELVHRRGLQPLRVQAQVEDRLALLRRESGARGWS